METTNVKQKTILTTVEEAKALIDYMEEGAKELVKEHPEITDFNVKLKATREVVTQYAKENGLIVYPPTSKDGGTFTVYIWKKGLNISLDTPYYKIVSQDIKYEAAK